MEKGLSTKALMLSKGKGVKIRVAPPGTKTPVKAMVAYLTEFLKAMVAYDIQHNHYDGETSVASQLSLFRSIPEAPAHLKCESVKRLQQDANEKGQALSVEEDTDFHQFDKYLNKVFCDEDEDKCYKVIEIQYDPSMNASTKAPR